MAAPRSFTTSFRKFSITVLLTLVFLEAGLRIGGKFSSFLQERRNQLSLRQKGEYRIICFGDSYTQGQYPPYLEEILNQGNIGIKFSVIDGSVAGTDTGFIVSQLETSLDKHQPHLVVSMMCISDDEARMPRLEDPPPQIILFLKSLRTYNLARLLWLHIKEMGFYKPQKDSGLMQRLKCNLQGIGSKVAYAEEDVLTQQETSLKKALELNPQDDEAYAKLGWIYMEQGKNGEAEQMFKKAHELNPQNEWVYMGLERLSGRLEGKEGKQWAYTESGWVYVNQERDDKTIEALKKTLELDPQNDETYVELGKLYMKQEKFDKAKEAFKKAIEINPQNDEAYVKLGWVYVREEKYAEAEEALKKAHELNTQIDEACVELARIYMRQERYVEAEQMLKKALEINSGNPWAHKVLMIVYGEMGNHVLRKEYEAKVKQDNQNHYGRVTTHNFHRFKEILNRRKMPWVCVQYPMRSIEPLKKMFEGEKGIFFVDNEEIFKNAVLREGWKEYFSNLGAGDFGRFTEKGNRLLAQNIAKVILKEVFGK